MSRFFVSCQLGFEQELLMEMQETWMEFFDPDGLPTRSAPPEFEVVQGGLEFEAPDHLGYQVNLFSKIANRVLIRIAKFESRYFDQFEKNLDKVKFSDWFAAVDTPLRLKAESTKSRLNNQKNIIEASVHALKRQNFAKISDREEPVESDSMQTIYIRAHHDRFTVSLDTSGEHLHRRGYASFRGEAPMRETLAAFIFRRASNYMSASEKILITDLFCGSGTLLFEAASSKSANLNRSYSFLNFKNVPKIFKSDSWKKNYRWLQSSSEKRSYVGVDRDEKVIKAAVSNFENFKTHFSYGSAKISFITQDSLSFDLISQKPDLNSKIWCICNPPYGIRLNDDSALKVLHAQELNLDGLALVHPSHWKFDFKKLKLAEQSDFSNQGISLKFSVFKTF